MQRCLLMILPLDSQLIYFVIKEQKEKETVITLKWDLQCTANYQLKFPKNSTGVDLL